MPEVDPDEAALRQIMQALDGADPDKLREIVRGHRELAEIKRNLGPQTKEELWDWVKERIGIELGKVAVCPGHVSQLDFAWWVYQFNSVLGVFSRGWGKTSLMAWVDGCQCEHYPGFGTFTIGPGRDQGERKYKHLLPLVVDGGVIGGKELPHVERSIQTQTQYKNGSNMEIALGGGVDNANGPREPRLHRDEIELMLDDTRKQAANIPAGKKSRDGRYMPAQTVDTSTMKWANGYVDRQMQAYYKKLEAADVDPTSMDPVEAFKLAIERGHRPQKMMMVSCVFEIAAENPTCRSVPEDERRARLLELDRDPDEICDCHTYDSDLWPSDDPEIDGVPRTLEDVCQGRFFRSRGYQHFEDIQTAFLDNDRVTWEAEKECSEPSREGAYLKSYSQDRNCIRGYVPDPENGPIDGSVDWGGGDEHWAGFFQELTRPVRCRSFKGLKYKTLPAGSIVIFGETFKAEIGNVELGKMVLEKMLRWIIEFPGWRVREFYYDTANRSGMLDWRDEVGIDLVSRIRKDFQEEVKMVRSLVGRIYVDMTSCPGADASFRGWRQVNGREIHNEHSHAMASVRYYAHNRRVLERELAREGSRTESRPAAADDQEDRPRERAEELERGVKIIRAQPRRKPLAGVAGAEDSPLRSGSRSIDRPDLRSQRTDR